MRHATTVLALFWVCGFCLAAIETDKPDFSGTWVLDRAASQITIPPDRAATNQLADVTLIIKTAGSALLCERHATVEGKQRTQKYDLFTDGRESTITDHAGREHQAKFGWQDNRLVGTYTTAVKWRGGQEIAIQVEQVQYLSADEKTMTIEIHRKMPRREVADILVFKKTST